MESSTCLPPTMLSWLGGRFFGACAGSLWPTAGPDTAPFRVVQASELLRSPRCLSPGGPHHRAQRWHHGVVSLGNAGGQQEGRVGHGRNAFESTGQPGSRVSGIGRRIPSKIRRRSETAGQARTGNGLLATAHQNDYTVRVSANSPRPAPPSCICRREWGSIRRRGQYSAICAAPGLRLIAVLWDAFIYCVPQ